MGDDGTPRGRLTVLRLEVLAQQGHSQTPDPLARNAQRGWEARAADPASFEHPVRAALAQVERARQAPRRQLRALRRRRRADRAGAAGGHSRGGARPRVRLSRPRAWVGA
ncbi:MAG TPA: hypothetical protein VMW47_10835 [Verrucomicrobiae bacterium]|nr:hypothetical protein [Verrucomicrobiae bacterium]